MDFIRANALYLGGTLVCVALTRYIYAGLTNALSNIPGPWYSRFTTLVSTYFVITAHHPDWVHALHEKYGPAVRISPHEVDISDAPACQRVIHSVKGGFLKSPFYSLLITDSSSVFNEIRPEIHHKYKRLLSNPMSETGLKTFLPRIDAKVRLAIERIREENKTRGAADVAKWFMFLSFDVIGNLTFGEGFGQLESGQPGFCRRPALHVPYHILALLIPPNAQVFIVGGSDTTANSMIYLIWCICKLPHVKSKLLRELATIPEDLGYDDLRDMPYLNWCVNETLRLYNALPCGLPRIVPEGGIELAGQFIPGGALHRDEKAFPDPYRFNPDRWEHTTQEMRDCTLPFGGGARSR
ncbi:cytochrome P450 [Diaporthe helianthi]|uniref:Cytochrome P450 n=1 Tax=Diaporthe helianthi TaxID=158607 RepID=A0A2P5HK43_DIAHE|nr:cytochrome P450 [Diaporthe helianthi]